MREPRWLIRTVYLAEPAVMLAPYTYPALERTMPRPGDLPQPTEPPLPDLDPDDLPINDPPLPGVPKPDTPIKDPPRPPEVPS